MTILKTAAVATCFTVMSLAFTPSQATDLGSIGSQALSSVTGGASASDLVLDAALGKMNLSQEKISEVKPIVNNVVSKGKSLMEQYNYNPQSPSATSAADLDSLKSAMSGLKAESSQALSGVVDGAIGNQIQSLISEKLLGGLL